MAHLLQQLEHSPGPLKSSVRLPCWPLSPPAGLVDNLTLQQPRASICRFGYLAPRGLMEEVAEG